MSPNPSQTRFPTLLRELRKRAGLTQAEVADALGIGRSTLATYETGNDLPGRETLAALATYYKVPLVVLLAAATGVNDSELVTEFVEGPGETWVRLSPAELTWNRFLRTMTGEQQDIMLAVVQELIHKWAAAKVA